MSDDTSLHEAIVTNRHDRTCPVHESMTMVLLGVSRRTKRIEVIGLILVGLTGGMLGKDLLLPLLMKLAGL